MAARTTAPPAAHNSKKKQPPPPQYHGKQNPRPQHQNNPIMPKISTQQHTKPPPGHPRTSSSSPNKIHYNHHPIILKCDNKTHNPPYTKSPQLLQLCYSNSTSTTTHSPPPTTTKRLLRSLSTPLVGGYGGWGAGARGASLEGPQGTRHEKKRSTRHYKHIFPADQTIQRSILAARQVDFILAAQIMMVFYFISSPEIIIYVNLVLVLNLT